MGAAGEDVYCTLLMSDSYLPGAVVLAHSLRDSGTTKKLAILVTLDSILHSTIQALKQLYDFIITVDKIANPNLENLARLDRLDLRFSFTKIVLWRQLQFRRILYVDCDVVAMRAPDELFAIDAPFAAAPDIGWPDIFNSGVMLLKPDMGEYWSLQTLASSGVSFDGADQGLLNEYFGNKPWHRLSFTYNCTPNSGYQYEPAYRHFRSSINMVHFIGKDKPWSQGRKVLSNSGSGVYKELLGRWWSVYDKHYKDTRSPPYSPGASKSRAVQQYVKDEEAAHVSDWATDGYPGHSDETSNDGSQQISGGMQQQDLPHSSHSEQPWTDPGDAVEDIDRGIVQPHPTSEQRRFSAPEMEWDATRSEPPAKSKPEAANFPSMRYEMSDDTKLFQAPAQYPAPPAEAGYKLPETKPAGNERPKAIFPWEERADRRKPARVFAEDEQVKPEPVTTDAPGGTSSKATREFAEDQAETSIPSTPQTPTIKISSADPWDSFSRTNAWDTMPSIEQYVRALKASQSRRGQVQVLKSSDSPTSGSQSPKRRESLILTDFPTEIERPSLPVTPAPMHRPTFWGDERNEEGELPGAEGVPEQAEWVCPRCRCRFYLPPKLVASVVRVVIDKESCCYLDAKSRGCRGREVVEEDAQSSSISSETSCEMLTSPLSTKDPTAQLEQLRRSSLIAAEELPNSPTKEIPVRVMPGSSIPLAGVFSPPEADLNKSIHTTTQSESSTQQETSSVERPVVPTAVATSSISGFSNVTSERSDHGGEVGPTTE